MSKTIEDLRAELFATIADLRGGKITTEVARAVSELSQVIVQSAKVEVDYVRAVGGEQSAFLDTAAVSQAPRIQHNGERPANGVAAVTRHLLGR